MSESLILNFSKLLLKSLVSIFPVEKYSSKLSQLWWGTRKSLSKPWISSGISRSKNLSWIDLLKSKLPSVIKDIICLVKFKSILDEPLVALDPDHPVFTR